MESGICVVCVVYGRRGWDWVKNCKINFIFDTRVDKL